MDRMVSAVNEKMKLVGIEVAQFCQLLRYCRYRTQIAADYANKSDTFAVVVQPFLSQSNAETFPLDYLSTVRIASCVCVGPMLG
jgi:hypothetical protein